MSRIRRVHDKQSTISAWRKVFRTTDPFSWPFQPSMEEGRILFPTDGYHLSANQYTALIHAIRCKGESSFLLAIIESKFTDLEQIRQNVWDCELPSYDEYCEIDLGLENALFSNLGEWGVIISHEMHGILGGSHLFLSSFHTSAGSATKESKAFGLQWESIQHQSWLEDLQRHLS